MFVEPFLDRSRRTLSSHRRTSESDPLQTSNGFSAVRLTHRPNLVYPAGRRRHKALGRYLVRRERIGVDRGTKSRWQYKLSGYELQRFGEQAYVRFQKSVELAGIANRDARDTGFHPTSKLRRQTVAEHRLHSPFVNRVERLAKQIEAAKTLELEFAEAHVRNCGCTLHIGEFADRLVQHQGNGRYARYPCVCLPVLGRARQLEQLNPGRIECHGEPTSIRLRIGADGIKSHRRAAGDRPMDELDATRVVLRRLADLDLEGTKAVLQALLDFPLDVSGRGTVEWGEQRQTRVSIHREQRMPLEHFDCREECGRRHLARGNIARDDGLGLARVLADDSRRVLAAESPAAISRLAARSRRDVSFAPPDPAVAVAYLDDDRFKLGEGAVGQHIRTNEGQLHGSQHNLLQSHRLSSVVCFCDAVARPLNGSVHYL